MQDKLKNWIFFKVFGQMTDGEHKLALHRLKYDLPAAEAHIRENMISWGSTASTELKCEIFFYRFKDDVPALIRHLKLIYEKELAELLELEAA